MVTDPIADMLTRIRNSVRALHDAVDMPSSQLKVRIADLLEREGYIAGFEVLPGEAHPVLRIVLKYDGERRSAITGLRRISKPGRRVYVGSDRIPRVIGGMGTAVISTSTGIITGHDARRQGVGGEVLCTVW
jgi:small subunit ribosomal protein S8